MPIEEYGNIVSFDNFDEAMTYLNQKETEANARVQPYQAALRPGDLVGRIVDIGEPLLILGRTVTPDQQYATLIEKYGNSPESEAEASYERASIIERFERGYLYGEWFALIEPHGEWGDAHISTLMPKIPDRVWNHWLAEIQIGQDPMKKRPE